MTSREMRSRVVDPLANDRWDTLVLVGLFVLGVGLPILIGAMSGSLDIARNDDWSYRRIALHLFQTGRVELDGSAGPTLLGQVFFAQPFLWFSGGQPWGLTAVGVLFDAVALAAGYLVMRRFLSRSLAALAIILVPLFPGYLPYAVSFMTDVPAMAAELVCLGLGAAALARRPIDSKLLLASLACGFFAFTIREFALAAPASVVLLAVISERRRASHWLYGTSLAASCLVFYLWRWHLPGLLGIGPHPVTAESIHRVWLGVSSLAFVLLPAAVVSWRAWWRRWRVVDVAFGIAVGVVLVGDRIAAFLATGSMPQVLL